MMAASALAAKLYERFTNVCVYVLTYEYRNAGVSMLVTEAVVSTIA